MNHLTTALATLVTAADAGPVGAAPWWVLLIPAMPLVGVALCTACAIAGVRNMLPAFLSVGCLGVSCALAVMMYANLAGQTTIATAFPWFDLPSGSAPGHRFTADFGFYIDSLTCLWMLFVTGLAALIALYASEYMSHDLGTGYCRFFVAFNLFVFSMACLVMADNFILLYLGWEGVGLCSYLLIGYFYKKPSAVAAAKKAFIVNRIGDLGLALGIMLTFVQFGSVEYAKVLPEAKKFVDLAVEGHWDQIPFLVQVIPVLLMVGAMGKSAQFPLYVWLPDAMEGPTPVSALIHAATMVTAGVFLVARTYWLFLCSPWALPSLAWIGGITALLAATIGMAQFDIKRIMAYSTVSQLGYMFAGLGVLTSTGAAFHVLTHAFFKALLFLACGAVMHGFAGQLDLRKLSGLRKVKGWGIVSITMLIGCANLAGLPLITSGYFSKDMILAEAFVTPGYAALGVLLLATAGLTAYYTFRVYFRVFEGPVHHEPGDELHDHTDHAHDDHAHADHGHDAHAHGHGHDHGPAQGQAHEPAHGHKADVHDFHPHAPGWAINSVLAILAVLSCAAIGLYFIDGENHGWVGGLIHDSTAHFASPFAEHAPASGHAPEPGHGGQSHATASTGHASILGVADVHTEMYFISGLVGIVGVGVAFLLHLRGRTTAANAPSDAIATKLGIIPRLATGKWYVDEIYDAIIRKPLLTLSHVFHLIDRLLVDGLVNLFGLLPRALAHAVRPMQNGVLHSYALGMAGGLALLLILVWLVTL